MPLPSTKQFDELKGELMDTDRLLRLLEIDLESAQRSIDRFDTMRFTIKGWTVTTSGAVLAVSVAAKNPLVSLVGVFLVLFFGYMELAYVDMQVRVMKRSRLIDQYLHAPELVPDEYTFGLGQVFQAKPFSIKVIPSLLTTRPEVYVFYLGLLVAIVFAYLVLAVTH